MGLSKVRVHIKVSNDKMQKEIEQFIKELPSAVMGEELEDIPEEFVYKNGLLSTDRIGFENFEETGKEISRIYGTPVMAVFVFDSDIASIQAYQNGQTVLEEFYTLSEEYGMKKDMDKEKFIQMFGFPCSAEELEEVFAMENVIFAEEILQKAGERIGIALI